MIFQKINKLKIDFSLLVPIKKTYLVGELVIILSSCPLLPQQRCCCLEKKNKQKHYANLKHVMNSSLQPFTINSTIITSSSIYNQYSSSHHNYCKARCCHFSCHRRHLWHHRSGAYQSAAGRVLLCGWFYLQQEWRWLPQSQRCWAKEEGQPAWSHKTRKNSSVVQVFWMFLSAWYEWEIIK